MNKSNKLIIFTYLLHGDIAAETSAAGNLPNLLKWRNFASFDKIAKAAENGAIAAENAASGNLPNFTAGQLERSNLLIQHKIGIGNLYPKTAVGIPSFFGLFK